MRRNNFNNNYSGDLTQIHILIPWIEDYVNISCRKTGYDGVDMITRA